MEEAASDDPRLAMKWRAFRSRRSTPIGRSEFVVGAVMGLPAPVPVEKMEVQADPESSKAKGGAKPGSKRKKANMPLVLRRSPRFPHRSLRLLCLARSQGRE
ncbi:hypothetical protein VPH35_029830 [Triticum aestivum]